MGMSPVGGSGVQNHHQRDAPLRLLLVLIIIFMVITAV